MTLTSEMSRITTGFEASQGERLASIAKIKPGLARENQLNRASLKRTMVAHRVATKNKLRDLFGMAALTRGAAVDMVERFGNEREVSTKDLLDQLASFADDLREAVSEQLAHLTATRVKTARREDHLRHAQLKDLRKRVEALIKGFSQDRQQAGEVWEQHVSTDVRRRRVAATRATPKAVATPRKPTARKTTKKKKHARS
jgi:hypothetical protein